jgi:hypothetical protein
VPQDLWPFVEPRQAHAQLSAVAHSVADLLAQMKQIHADIPYTRFGQLAHGALDQRLATDLDQRLGNPVGPGSQPGAKACRQNESAHLALLFAGVTRRLRARRVFRTLGWGAASRKNHDLHKT